MTSPRVAPDSPGAVLQLIRAGAVSSRAKLAKLLGVSASTAGLRVQALIDHGYVQELDDGLPQGGRRPRRIVLRPDYGEVIAVDLGSHHAAMGQYDMNFRLIEEHEHTPVRIEEGPDAVLGWVTETIENQKIEPKRLRGITIGVPGPVDAGTGRVVSPSRMPGWHGVNVRVQMFGRGARVPVLVDNDANLAGLGEHAVAPVEHMVYLKAGSGIGCGVIASGRLHRGSVGAAGDISHLPVPGHEHTPCSCGRSGCLDTVASGAALVRDLQTVGARVRTPNDVVALAADADPIATRMLRDAGRATGELLATVVNFFNPDALVIGGLLSRTEPFVASVRAAVFERSLPMATENLQVRTSRAGHRAGIHGGARLMVEHLLDPQRVNETIENG
ncbi:ROK family protein [Actinophytocola sp.]|uniref:ROK family protein n=1 Tax=Actinophytocola sp. TaxID=1872138 RepID=UPI002D6543DB|nr:ROK family protein [Actinophytocola sp.]HYQ65124.1 ROK family protein [Actinophytocola sp.]